MLVGGDDESAIERRMLVVSYVLVGAGSNRSGGSQEWNGVAYVKPCCGYGFTCRSLA